MKRAQLADLAKSYGYIVEQSARNYSAYVPDLPGCIATARSKAALNQRIQTAVMTHLGAIIADGDNPPQPKMWNLVSGERCGPVRLRSGWKQTRKALCAGFRFLGHPFRGSSMYKCAELQVCVRVEGGRIESLIRSGPVSWNGVPLHGEKAIHILRQLPGVFERDMRDRRLEALSSIDFGLMLWCERGSIRSVSLW